MRSMALLLLQKSKLVRKKSEKKLILKTDKYNYFPMLSIKLTIKQSVKNTQRAFFSP
jgi:hypothetical protein